MAVFSQNCMKTGEGQICPTGQSWLTPALNWGQSHLSKGHVESYLPSYLKTSSASPSALSSSQSPVDQAPCHLSHWRYTTAPAFEALSCLQFLSLGFVCQCDTFAHLSPQPRRLLIFLPPCFWGCCSSLWLQSRCPPFLTLFIHFFIHVFN